MAAVLGIGVFALVAGAEPAFAHHHVGDITLQIAGNITDTNTLKITNLWSLEAITIGDRHYLITAPRNPDSGLQILDITDPTNIRAAGHVNHTSGSTALRNNLGLDIHQIGTSIYALTTSFQDKGMQITNVTDPSNPAAVSRVT